MPQRYLFEYAVIRVVPKVEREEFINIGVVVYCKDQQFLQMKYALDQKRLAVFSATTDINELTAHLCAFERICNSDPAAGPIGKLDIASRFRWLTATRSTILQTSKVHPGLSGDSSEMLNRLYLKLVEYS